MFEIFIYANFITILIYPNGIYATNTTNENWFLGYDNIHVSFFLPGLLISLLHAKLTKKKFRAFLFIGIVYISAVIRFSATTISALLIFALIFIPLIRKKHNIFNFRNYLLISIACYFATFVLNFSEYLIPMSEKIMQKGASLEARLNFWSTAIQYISEKPIIGRGWKTIEFRHVMYNDDSILSAHNQIIEYLLIGGIVQLCIYLYLCFYANINLMKNREYDIIQFISIAFLSLQILFFSEVFSNLLVYLIILCSLYSSSILKNYNTTMKSI
jgi:O-antigen ligase